MGVRVIYNRVGSPVYHWACNRPGHIELITQTMRGWVDESTLENAREDDFVLMDLEVDTIAELQEFVGSPAHRQATKTPPELHGDKAAPGIHFILTGTGSRDGGSPPECLATLGAPSYGEGVRMFQALDSSRVTWVAEVLSSVDETEFDERYDAKRLDELKVPPDWSWTRRGDEACYYLRERFFQLRDYYQEAAKNDEAMLIRWTY